METLFSPMRFSGLLLTDSSLRPLASNREAKAILGYSDRSGIKSRLVSAVPKEVLERIRLANSGEGLALLTTLSAGGMEYTCRVYSMELYRNKGSVAERILAFVIDKNCADDTHAATRKLHLISI
jgi:hypothetical protein